MSAGFSLTKLSLINRDIIWVTAHIRGGMERGMKWWKEGKLLNKKNTFKDYIAVAKFLIDKKYTSKGKFIGMGYVRSDRYIDHDFVLSGDYELEVATKRVRANVCLKPLYDPKLEKVKT